jgi:hypothetical protein
VIQLWFRSQARRGDFWRRQVSSRTATFAEAFSYNKPSEQIHHNPFSSCVAGAY